ncbi:MAG: PD-(D/E)XK motif protein [Selenomonadaceae bacterium]
MMSEINNVDDLKEQWAHTQKAPSGYTKIANNHPLEWYIGYDGNLKESIMVVSEHKNDVFNSSKSIEVVHGERKDGRWFLVMSLTDSRQMDVFTNMCFDLLSYSGKGINENAAYQMLQRRYLEWDRLLQHSTNGIMTPESQRGLWGEVHFLISLIDDGMDCLTAVKGWLGPANEHQDFIYDDVWYEIKTVMNGADKVHISSLEQLSNKSYGELVLHRIMKTVSQDGETLNQIIDKLHQKCEGNAQAEELVADKLAQVGYMMRAEEYDDVSYKVETINRYDVRDDFPRLTNWNVPEQIVEASYALSIAGLEPWKI